MKRTISDTEPSRALAMSRVESARPIYYEYSADLNVCVETSDRREIDPLKWKAGKAS